MRDAALAQAAADTPLNSRVKLHLALFLTRKLIRKRQVTHKGRQDGWYDTQTAWADLWEVYHNDTEHYRYPTVRVRHDYKQEVNRKQNLFFLSFKNIISIQWVYIRYSYTVPCMQNNK